MIARHYVIDAKPGQADALARELERLADTVRAVPGSTGFELLRDVDEADRFVFIEKWESVEAHKGALAHIPREAFAGLMAAAAASPSGRYLDYVKVV